MITANDPVCVKYFEPTSRGEKTYTLNDNVFEVFAEDLLEKVKDPVIIPIGRSRLFYHFD